MPYAVSDRMALSVFIEGQELPFSEAFTFNYLHMSAGSRQALPYFTLSVTDNLKWLFMSSLLKDSHRVRIVAQSGTVESSQDYAFEFRLTFFKEKPLMAGSLFTLEGVLDVPKYLHNSSRNPITGTSSDVLRQVAQTAGLEFEGVGTNDSQVWLPMNRRLFQFARYVANAGFATENSAMLLAVDLTKKMVYRDVTAMDSPKHTLGLMNFDSGKVIPVTSVQPVASPGALNHIAGYTLSTVEQDLESETVHSRNKAVGTTINEPGDLLVNSDLRSDTREGRVAYAPVDAGNAHEHFVRAQHQNRRVLSLFSFGVYVVIPTLTDIQVLDTVSLDASMVASEDAGSSSIYTGLYRVVHKVVYGKPGQLVEKLLLVRRTITNPAAVTSQNGTPGSLIATPTDQANRVSPLPFPIDSKLDVPGFNADGFVASVSAYAGTATAAIASSASSASSGMSYSLTAMDGAPQVTPLLVEAKDDITALKNTCIAQINAIKAVDPLDEGGAIPPLVVSFKNQIDASIEEDMPAIELAASRTASIATAAKTVSSSSATSSSVFARAQAAVNAGMNALAAVRSPGSLTSEITVGKASVTQAVSTSTTSLTSGASSTIAEADALLVDATTYQAQIDAARAAAFAAIDAAAVIP